MYIELLMQSVLDIKPASPYLGVSFVIYQLQYLYLNLTTRILHGTVLHGHATAQCPALEETMSLDSNVSGAPKF